MDIVGDAIRALRIGEPRSARAHLYGHWGLRWDPSRGAGFNIHVVLEGTAWLLPEHHPATPLRAGDVVFVSRSIAHGIADSPATSVIDVPPDEADFWFGKHPDPDQPDDVPHTVLIGGSYYMQEQRMHPLIESLPPVMHLSARVDPADPIGAIVALLGREHDHERPGSTAAMPALLDLLLTYVIRSAFEEADATTGWAAVVRDRALSSALDHMQNRPDQPWTIASLAAVAGLSRATLARRFTELVGRPPMAYLRWWRMNIARALLRETDLSLSAVAERVGYQSEFAFSKAFSREAGESPSSFRRTSRTAATQGRAEIPVGSLLDSTGAGAARSSY